MYLRSSPQVLLCWFAVLTAVKVYLIFYCHISEKIGLAFLKNTLLLSNLMLRIFMQFTKPVESKVAD